MDEVKSISELTRRVLQFRDARDWGQYHNPKDLALSLAVEAGELLEHFQWRSSDEAVAEAHQEIVDELGDVLIYTVLLCHELGLDPLTVAARKLTKNEKKYPVDQARGSRRKYTDLS